MPKLVAYRRTLHEIKQAEDQQEIDNLKMEAKQPKRVIVRKCRQNPSDEGYHVDILLLLFTILSIAILK